MNINQNKLNSRLLSTMLVLFAFAFNSCTQEPIGVSMPGGDGMKVRVTSPQSGGTKSIEEGSGVENQLDEIIILVFNEDGSKLETELTVDLTSSDLSTSQPQWETDKILTVNSIIDPSSPKEIYVLANFDKSNFDKDTFTETMLKEEIKTISAMADINDKTKPMLMSGSTTVENLAAESYSVAVILERQLSKIRTTFTISSTVRNSLPNAAWQTDAMKITVANVPNQSYVVGRAASPANASLLNFVEIAVDDSKPSSSSLPTGDWVWSECVYVYENPVEGKTQISKDASTYIIMQLPYKNKLTGVVESDNYYKLHINNTLDTESPHKVLRNTIYDLNISIKGMGLPFNNLAPDVNAEVQLTVTDWEGEIVDVEDDPRHYFNVNRTHIGFQSFETSLQSIIATDVDDWKLVNENGTTVVSFAENTTKAIIEGITYTLNGTASAATVVVNRPADVTTTVPQKMFFIAKNLKVPFTVVYDNGFIPNSVLSAEGWPTDKLPANGLQLAKRGNVLPARVAKADDPQIQWSTQIEDTGVNSDKLGSGKDNYAQLNALDAVTYPIGQACNDLGIGWYVPSRNEWQLILKNNTTFSTSYFFGSFYSYWSTTEAEDWERSWYIEPSAYSHTSDKTTRYKVRCVRAI